MQTATISRIFGTLTRGASILTSMATPSSSRSNSPAAIQRSRSDSNSVLRVPSGSNKSTSGSPTARQSGDSAREATVVVQSGRRSFDDENEMVDLTQSEHVFSAPPNRWNQNDGGDGEQEEEKGHDTEDGSQPSENPSVGDSQSQTSLRSQGSSQQGATRKPRPVSAQRARKASARAKSSKTVVEVEHAGQSAEGARSELAAIRALQGSDDEAGESKEDRVIRSVSSDSANSGVNALAKAAVRRKERQSISPAALKRGVAAHMSPVRAMFGSVEDDDGQQQDGDSWNEPATERKVSEVVAVAPPPPPPPAHAQARPSIPVPPPPPPAPRASVPAPPPPPAAKVAPSQAYPVVSSHSKQMTRRTSFGEVNMDTATVPFVARSGSDRSMSPNVPADQLYHGESLSEPQSKKKAQRFAQYSSRSSAYNKGTKEFGVSTIAPTRDSPQTANWMTDADDDNDDADDPYDALNKLDIPADAGIFGLAEDDSDGDYAPVAVPPCSSQPAPPVTTVQKPVAPAAPKANLSFAASIFGMVADDSGSDAEQFTPPPVAAPVATRQVPAKDDRSRTPPPRGEAVSEGSPVMQRQQRQEQTKQMQAVLSKEVQEHLSHRAPAPVGGPCIEEKLQARKAEAAAKEEPTSIATGKPATARDMLRSLSANRLRKENSADEQPSVAEAAPVPTATEKPATAREMLRALSANRQTKSASRVPLQQPSVAAPVITEQPTAAPVNLTRQQGFVNPLAAMKRNSIATNSISQTVGVSWGQESTAPVTPSFQPPLPFSPPPPPTPPHASHTQNNNIFSAHGKPSTQSHLHHQQHEPLTLSLPLDSPMSTQTASPASAASGGTGSRSTSRMRSYQKIMGGRETQSPLPESTPVDSPSVPSQQAQAQSAPASMIGATNSRVPVSAFNPSSLQQQGPPSQQAPGSPAVNGRPPTTSTGKASWTTAPPPPAGAPPRSPAQSGAARCFSPVRTSSVQYFDPSSRTSSPANAAPVRSSLLAEKLSPKPEKVIPVEPIVVTQPLVLESKVPTDESAASSISASNISDLTANRVIPSARVTGSAPVWASMHRPANELNKILAAPSSPPQMKSPPHNARKHMPGLEPSQVSHSPPVTRPKRRSPNPVRPFAIVNDSVLAAPIETKKSNASTVSSPKAAQKKLGNQTATPSKQNVEQKASELLLGAAPASAPAPKQPELVELPDAVAIDRMSQHDSQVLDAALPNSMFLQQARTVLAATQSKILAVAQAFNAVLPSADSLAAAFPTNASTNPPGELNAFEQLQVERRQIAATILQLQELESLSVLRIEQAERSSLEYVQLEAQRSLQAVCDAESALQVKIRDYNETVAREKIVLDKWNRQLIAHQQALEVQNKQRINQLTQLALALGTQNKHLALQKRRVREQRFQLDLALQDINTHRPINGNRSPLRAAALPFNSQNASAPRGLPKEEFFSHFSDNVDTPFDPAAYQHINLIAPPGFDSKLASHFSAPGDENFAPNNAPASNVEDVQGESTRESAPEEDDEEPGVNRDDFVRAVRKFKAEQMKMNGEVDRWSSGFSSFSTTAQGAGVGAGPGAAVPAWAARLSLGARLGSQSSRQQLPVEVGVHYYDSGGESTGNSRSTSATRSTVRTGMSRSTGYASSSVATTVGTRNVSRTKRIPGFSAPTPSNSNVDPNTSTASVKSTHPPKASVATGSAHTVHAVTGTITIGDSVKPSRSVVSVAGSGPARVHVSPLSSRKKRSNSPAAHLIQTRAFK